MDHPYLSVRGLQAGYGRAQVLFDISFEVRRGEVVTLLGRNGMGRSTTVKCLFGLLASRAGEIELGGQRTRGWPPHRIARQGIALVPEGRQIFTDLTVEENLVATARAAGEHGGREWTLERVYARFPILARLRHRGGEYLSGGEAQLVAIARALLMHPRLVLLDEPSQGLAPRIVEDIMAVIEEIREEGIAILIVEQNSSLALSIAHRAYVIEDGRIVHESAATALEADADLKHRLLAV